LWLGLCALYWLGSGVVEALEEVAQVADGDGSDGAYNPCAGHTAGGCLCGMISGRIGQGALEVLTADISPNYRLPHKLLKPFEIDG